MDYDNLFAILSYTSRQKKKKGGRGTKSKTSQRDNAQTKYACRPYI